jgi:hypothetical protein
MQISMEEDHEPLAEHQVRSYFRQLVSGIEYCELEDFV